MAQLDRSQRRESPRTPISPTIEMLRDGEALRRSSTPNSPRRQDQEEDHGHQNSPKKSVLTKVKEKAKKFKHSLSFKKKHNDHDDNASPTWRSSFEHDNQEEEEEEDAEYFGAPMYESELAPESYKETARLHPRANPAICEKHLMPATLSNKENVTVEGTNIKPNQTKPTDGKQSGPHKTITENITKKILTPALETVTEDIGPAYNSVISKIQGLTIANLSPKEASQTNNNNKNQDKINSSSPLASRSSSNTSSPQKSGQLQSESEIWDKGVSVKDYLLNKFEPGEEDRALSRVISEAMSSSPRTPKKTSRGNTTSELSVADKVREAITSLLSNRQPQYSPSMQAVLTRCDTTPSMPRHLPVSTNANEVKEEENLGRILQTN